MNPIDLLKAVAYLCEQHPEVETFRTFVSGMPDTRPTEYPIVRMRFPYSISSSENGEMLTLSVSLEVRDNSASIDNGSIIFRQNMNFFTEKSKLNEKKDDIVKENLIREGCNRIAFQIYQGLRLQKDNLNATFSSAEITSIERSGANVDTGVSLEFSVSFPNPYICEANAIYNKNPILL